MNFAIPIQRLRETETLLAFYRPRPSCPFHDLLLPKKALLPEFDSTDVIQSLVSKFHFPAYRLIVNSGEDQDFSQLHFHLISEVEGQRLQI